MTNVNTVNYDQCERCKLWPPNTTNCDQHEHSERINCNQQLHKHNTLHTCVPNEPLLNRLVEECNAASLLPPLPPVDLSQVWSLVGGPNLMTLQQSSHLSGRKPAELSPISTKVTPCHRPVTPSQSWVREWMLCYLATYSLCACCYTQQLKETQWHQPQTSGCVRRLCITLYAWNNYLWQPLLVPFQWWTYFHNTRALSRVFPSIIWMGQVCLDG